MSRGVVVGCCLAAPAASLSALSGAGAKESNFVRLSLDPGARGRADICGRREHVSRITRGQSAVARITVPGIALPQRTPFVIAVRQCRNGRFTTVRRMRVELPPFRQALSKPIRRLRTGEYRIEALLNGDRPPIAGAVRHLIVRRSSATAAGAQGLLAYVQPAPVDPYPPGYVACVDRSTLEPLAGKVEIQEFHGGWGLSPDGAKLAMTLSHAGITPGGGGRVGIWVIDLRSSSVATEVHTGVYAEAVVWVAPARLLARVARGRRLGPDSPGPVISLIDARNGSILKETPLPHDATELTATTRKRLVTLAPDPTRLVVANADGSVETVRLRAFGRRLDNSTALLTDARREIAYVIARGRPVAEVSLARLQVRYHTLRQVRRIRIAGHGAVAPARAGSGVPAATGIWVRDGIGAVVVPALAPRRRNWRVALVDTKRWQVMPVDRSGTGVAHAPQGVIAYGPRGVRGYRFDGGLDFSLLGSERLSGTQVTGVGTRAYISLFGDSYELRVIDTQQRATLLTRTAPGAWIESLIGESCTPGLATATSHVLG